MGMAKRKQYRFIYRSRLEDAELLLGPSPGCHAILRRDEVEVEEAEEPVPEWIEDVTRTWLDGLGEERNLAKVVHRAYLAAKERGEA